MPRVSIVIRTLNEERHLGNLLASIEKQDYKDHEVIVVDSGSSDKTLEVAKKFKAKIINIESRDFTFGYALNVGCEAARGGHLVFVSAHVLPTNDSWLSNLVSPFEDPEVAMVYGRQLPVVHSKFSEKQDFKRLFKNDPINSNVPIEYANNANSAIRKELWKSHPFDEYLFGLDDIDWARHMTEMGHIIRYEPKASIYHIHEEKWHQVFNRYRREAIAAHKIGLAHPPQARISFLWFLLRLLNDFVISFPNWRFERLEEILRFRYYQWKGSMIGWYQAKDIHFKKGDPIFYPLENRSVVIKGKGRAELEKMALPELRPGEVMLRVDYVGICRTDLEVLEKTLGYYRDGVAKYPIVPGHEFSGTVMRVGASSKFQERWKPGHRGVGECILSRDPQSRMEVGVINYNGAYSNYIIMPGDAVHHIPEGLDLMHAALTEPLAVVLRSIRRIKNRLKPEANIAVIGAGPIGNLCAQTLSHDGYKVTVFDKNEKRLKVLEDIIKKTSTKLGGLEKFDAVFECTGAKEVLERVIKESKSDGTVMLLGFPYGDISYNFEDLVGQEKIIAGSVGGEKEDFPKALKLLSELDLREFTKVVMPLEDFKKAWELHSTGKYLKIFLKP